METIATGAGQSIGFTYTPADMLNYLKLLNNDWQTLAKEIQASTVRDHFKRSYAQILNTWDGFFADAGRGGPGGWWDRGLGGVRELSDKYARRLVQWRKAFEKEGFTSTIRTVAKEPATSHWFAIAIVLGLVTAGYVYFSTRR